VQAESRGSAQRWRLIVAIGQTPPLGEIERSFAERIRAEPAAQALHVRAHRETVELWLMTTPADYDTVRRLHEAGVAVEEQFPDVELRLHVLNARNYPGTDFTTLIPTGAEEIPLRQE
jgi:hypothetical protein